MALTSSGTISMSDIRTELGDSGTISLKEASDGTIATINTGNDAANRPDGSAPHAMSEFYSYNHSATSVGVPTSLSYTAASTTTTTFTFTEASSTSRVYVYLWNLNGDDNSEGEVISVDGSTYITVDGSGTTSKTLGDGNDTFEDQEEEETATLTLATNDYVDIKFRSWNSGFSAYTSELRCWTLPTAPGAPTLSVISSTQINASWSAPTGGASSYIVYRDAGSSTPTTQAATPSGTSQSLTGLTPNFQYGVRLKSVGGGGDSSAFGTTATAITNVGAPSSLNMPVDGRDNTALEPSWTASPGGTPTLYQLTYDTNSLFSSPTSVNTSDGSATSFQITGLTQNTTYYIKVRAYSTNNSGNFSSYSNTLTTSTTNR